ncbi:MAG: hypothetical protein J3Q66DRAFT_121574 [Benniella sp.]|nr:MAG: hypothetical protein J3Q66DRAFT_121574 [Benniella sp.]
MEGILRGKPPKPMIPFISIRWVLQQRSTASSRTLCSSERIQSTFEAIRTRGYRSTLDPTRATIKVKAPRRYKHLMDHMLLRNEDLKAHQLFPTVLPRPSLANSTVDRSRPLPWSSAKTEERHYNKARSHLRALSVMRSLLDVLSARLPSTCSNCSRKGAPFLNDGYWFLWKVVPSPSDPKTGLSS